MVLIKNSYKKRNYYFLVSFSSVIIMIATLFGCESETGPLLYNYGWDRLESGASLNLNDVTFSDSLNGWICGDYGTLLHSNDGGSSWLIQSLPDTANLIKIAFPEPEIGFVMSENNFYKTIDAGVSWNPVIVDESIGGPSDFQFINKNKGWLSGMKLFTTEDGGNSWKDITPDTEGLIFIRIIFSFSNDLSGYAVVNVFDTVSEREGTFNLFYHSSDGGINWQKNNMDSSRLFYNSFYYSKIITLTNHNCFMYNYWYTGRIYRSTDLGTSWSEIATGAYSSLFHFNLVSNIFNLDEKNIYITSFTSTNTDRKVSYISHSSDGGLSFTAYQTGIYGKVNSGYYKNKSQGWLVGDKGLILRTTNGGVTYYDK
ncbi:MAG: hypothetical protein QG635_2032 [Bacteroidota bacterium]|nr:hypothetical protein [Bacteroidota bacterium]